MKLDIFSLKIFLTGGVTLGLELAASRILTPFFGVSIFVWSSILSITLVALALGYKGGGILAQRLNPDQARVVFAMAGGLAAAWIDLCLWTYPFLFWPLSHFDLVIGSIVACLYLLFVPLVILSALNPLLVVILGRGKDGDAGAGHVFFISTIGSVAGVFAVAYGLLPHFTNYQTVTILAGCLALLSLLAFWQARIRSTPGIAVAVAALVMALAIAGSGGLERLTRNIHYKGSIWNVVAAAPSYFGNLQVVDIANEDGILMKRALLNDGLAQNIFDSTGRSSSLYSYALEKMALAAKPDARKALVLGIGAGVLPQSLAEAGVDVTAVEINPEIIDIARDHLNFLPDAIKIDIADARTAARQCAPDNDIVAVDLFHGDGIPEHLVTVEFFADLFHCLKDGGVLVMNSFIALKNPLPEHALIQTLAKVFGTVYMAQKPVKPGNDFTSAYILTRKGDPLQSLEAMDVSDMPIDMARDLLESLRHTTLYTYQDTKLGNAPVLTDISNQWKNLAYGNELAYRRDVISALPWQILMN